MAAKNTKLISMHIDAELLDKVDKKAAEANEGKQRGRTEWVLEAIRAALDGRPAPSDKRLAAIVAAYEGMNAKGRRYLATCAALAEAHKEFKA